MKWQQKTKQPRDTQQRNQHNARFDANSEKITINICVN